jgi:hypothetical protein
MPIVWGILYVGALYGFGSLAYYAGHKKGERDRAEGK